MRAFVVEALNDLGLEIMEAGNGDAALRILEGAENVDLLCTDINMPGTLSGFDLAEKARGQHPGLKVIYMTGYVENLGDLRAANDESPMLAKPFNANDLKASVRRLLAR